MTSEWQQATIGDVATIKHGFAFKGEYFSDDAQSYVLVTPGNFAIGGGFQLGKSKFYSGPVPADYVLSEGDLVVTMTDLSKASDTLGYAARVPMTPGITYLHNQRVGLVQVKDSNAVSPGWLHYLLRTSGYRSWVVGSASGTTVKHTSPSRISSYAFRLPPPDHQLEVAATLDAIENRINGLRQINTTLEAIVRALFKSWFVDFDPVCAKAEGVMPLGMDADTAALFPSAFEESELGLIPKGWIAKPFGELLNNSIGGDWGSDAVTDEQSERVAIIRGTDIPDLRSQSACRVPIRFTTQRKAAARELVVGDLVVEVSGGSKDQPTGRSLYLTKAMLSQFDCRVVPASFCRKFSPSTSQLGLLLGQHMDFMYAAGRTWEYQNQSTGIANFQTKHFLENERVVVPSAAVLNAFFELVSPMVERTQLLQASRLAQMRDTLLPRLISGKLGLPEAEALIEDALA